MTATTVILDPTVIVLVYLWDQLEERRAHFQGGSDAQLLSWGINIALDFVAIELVQKGVMGNATFSTDAERRSAVRQWRARIKTPR